MLGVRLCSTNLLGIRSALCFRHSDQRGIQLPRSVIRPRSRAMTIRGKGNKERLVPVHERAVHAVGRWRKLAQAQGTGSDKWLFHAVRDGSRPLTSQAALLEIKDAAL